MKTQNVVIGLVIVLLTIVGIALYSGSLGGGVTPSPTAAVSQSPVSPGGGPVACAQDAMLCPDGSYVGRTGPRCEFSACPTPSTTPPSGTIVTVVVALNQSASGLGVTVVPLEVTEDSRCPIGVMCIQAGTVRVRSTLSMPTGNISQVFTLNQPINTENATIELFEVAPIKRAGETFFASDYRFSFRIMKH